MSFSPKPSTCEVASGSFSASLKAFIAFKGGVGPPRDIVTNTIGYHASAVINSLRSQPFAGGCPSWVATGFPYATAADVTMKLWSMGAGIMFPTDTVPSSYPSARTLCITFKINRPPFQSNNHKWLVGLGAANGLPGLTAQAYAQTNQGGGAYKLGLYNQSSIISPPTDMILWPGVWYTAACSQDESGGAGTYIRDWWLYDWSTGITYHQQQTAQTVAWYATGTKQLTIGMGSTTGYRGLDGEVYSALYDGQAWTSVNGLFATLIGDPIAPARGTYSGGGTLAAGQAYSWGQSNTSVELGTARPINGTPPYTYQWHKSATAGFTPGVGTAISGATSRRFTDTPGAGDWWYKVVCTDSASNSVTSVLPFESNASQIPVSLDETSPLWLTCIGDSITDNLGDLVFERLLAMRQAPARGFNCGVQGGQSQPSLGVTFVHPGTYQVATRGVPTGGTFRLSFGGAETVDIAYNASAATIATALGAIPALTGNVTTSGGALPSAVFVLLAGTAGTGITDLVVSNNSLTGGSQAGVYAHNVVRAGINALVAEGGSLASIQLGANDNPTSATAWKAGIVDYVNYLNAKGVKAILHYTFPREDTPYESIVASLQSYMAKVDEIVADFNDVTKCVHGDVRGWKAAKRLFNKQYFDSSLVHPTVDLFRSQQANLQSLGVAIAIGQTVPTPSGDQTISAILLGAM